MAVLEYLSVHLENTLTIAFYALVILLLVVYRKKFDFQAKVIALYRTKFGLKFIERYAKKHREFIKLLGYIGIGIGFVGMIFILVLIFKGAYALFAQPDAPATMSLVLPGINVPGSPLKIPLWVIIPLFFVVLIHEAGHGLVAKANKIPIKNTGFVFFGPLAGAFVEPDDKKLAKTDDVTQFAVFAAGPFANFLTAAIAMLILILIFIPLVPIPFAGNAGVLVTPTGFSAGEIPAGLPAAKAGLVAGATYTFINNHSINSTKDLIIALKDTVPNQTIHIGNSTNNYTLITAAHPNDPTRGYLGVMNLQTVYGIKKGVPHWIYQIIRIIGAFFFWVYALSLGLGAFNLLPLGPVDGGQMIRLALRRIFGEKKGHIYWAKLGIFLLIIVVILVIVPIVKALI